VLARGIRHATPSPEHNGAVRTISKVAPEGLSAGMMLRQVRAWPASMPPAHPASVQVSATAARSAQHSSCRA
jgi:hypothetical protein